MTDTSSRIQQLFRDHKAYVGYLTAGDGGIKQTLLAALALIRGGVNLLEIGIPFSDPVADGPVIQRASARALASGTTLKDVLWLITEIRKESQIPLVIFSYLNPILAGQKINFLAKAKAAGVDALLLVDCSLEESSFIHQECSYLGLDLIQVITSSTPIVRARAINQVAQGFIYYACRKGTTGTRQALPPDFQQSLQSIQSVVTHPLVVGFGISNAQMVKQVLNHADGVVVGSLFVKMLEEGLAPKNLEDVARQLFKED